jgi:DNA replication and repair protein RecF
LDRALFQADPSYPGWISDYNRALQCRNRILKDRPQSIELLKPFDIQLAKLGSRITESRQRFLDAVRPVFIEAAARIGKGISVSLNYKPDVEGDEFAFEAALMNSFSRERERGFTLRGPHSDDVEIEVTGLPAKRFASQGQQRMVVLSLKIAEANALSLACGRIPILLLDDISSELDRERNREFFSFLQQSAGQVFITTTHLDHVLLDSDRRDFNIENGVLSMVSAHYC